MAEGRIRVMIVDDHRMFADSLSRLLADEDGISVVGSAADAVEAIAALGSGGVRADVALIDYQMPGTDGVVLTRLLKDIDPELLVVMLTGYDDDRVLLDAIEAGCSGFLTKDRAAAEVVDAVRAVASGEALISPQMLARLLPQLRRSEQPLGSDFTDREKEILGRMARGLTNRAIAEDLFLSVNTVRNYAQSILNKLGAHSKLEAVSMAARAGLIDYSAG